MPTRYLKPGIRDSGRIEALSATPDAECLYYRLLVTVDDFGRTDARALVIKANCFPIRMRATADKCMQWLATLADVGLIVIYTVEDKQYLQITRWDNKPRAERSKFPAPSPDVYKCPQMLPVTVTVTGTETVTETVTETHTLRTDTLNAFDQFWQAYPSKKDKKKALKAWQKINPEQLPAILTAIELQSHSDQWQRGFIPHPTTWLNGERWQDEMPTPETSALGQCNWNRNNTREPGPRCAEIATTETSNGAYCKTHAARINVV